MRVIGLFKAKSACDDKWVYGWFSHSEGVPRIMDNEGKQTLVNPDTVCEYTGLGDARGELIFEGDILNYDDDYVYVTFSDGRFNIEDGKSIDDLDSCNEDYRIIGNIYDNPEWKEYFEDEVRS